MGTRARPARRLTALDAATLLLEEERSPLHLGAVLLVDGPAPDLDRFRAAVEDRLAGRSWLRCRVRRSHGGLLRPYWEADPAFAIDDHVTGVCLGPGDGLEARVVPWVDRRLDPAHPPWALLLVDGLPGARFAVVLKAHHALLDGVAGVGLVESLLDPDPDADPPTVRATGGAGLLDAPTSLRIRLRGARQFVHPDLPPSALNGPLCGRRTWAWTEAPLEDVRTVAHRAGGTIGDAALAAVTTALRSVLLAGGTKAVDLQVRCIVPVSARPPEGGIEVGNRVAGMFVDLPVGEPDAAARLAAIVARTSQTKRSGTTHGILMALRSADLVPYGLLARAARRYAAAGQQRVNLVVTDVPGPVGPTHLLGHGVRHVVPCTPLGVSVRVTVGVLSYDGRLAFGVSADADALPDAAVLRDALDAGLAELLR